MASCSSKSTGVRYAWRLAVRKCSSPKLFSPAFIEEWRTYISLRNLKGGATHTASGAFTATCIRMVALVAIWSHMPPVRALWWVAVWDYSHMCLYTMPILNPYRGVVPAFVPYMDSSRMEPYIFAPLDYSPVGSSRYLVWTTILCVGSALLSCGLFKIPLVWTTPLWTILLCGLCTILSCGLLWALLWTLCCMRQSSSVLGQSFFVLGQSFSVLGQGT